MNDSRRRMLPYFFAYASLLGILLVASAPEILQHFVEGPLWLSFVIGEAQNLYQPDQNGLYQGVAGFFSSPGPGHEAYPWGTGTILLFVMSSLLMVSAFLITRFDKTDK